MYLDTACKSIIHATAPYRISQLPNICRWYCLPINTICTLIIQLRESCCNSHESFAGERICHILCEVSTNHRVQNWALPFILIILSGSEHRTASYLHVNKMTSWSPRPSLFQPYYRVKWNNGALQQFTPRRNSFVKLAIDMLLVCNPNLCPHVIAQWFQNLDYLQGVAALLCMWHSELVAQIFTYCQSKTKAASQWSLNRLDTQSF